MRAISYACASDDICAFNTEFGFIGCFPSTFFGSHIKTKGNVPIITVSGPLNEYGAAYVCIDRSTHISYSMSTVEYGTAAW